MRRMKCPRVMVPAVLLCSVAACGNGSSNESDGAGGSMSGTGAGSTSTASESETDVTTNDAADGTVSSSAAATSIGDSTEGTSEVTSGGLEEGSTTEGSSSGSSSGGGEIYACGASTPGGTAELRLTELYVGIDGPDGTDTWFEITNVGDGDGDLSALYYGNATGDPTQAVGLPSLALFPGCSAIILLSGSKGALFEFEAVWGEDAAIVEQLVGPSLQSSGTAYLFDGDGVGATLMQSAPYEALPGAPVNPTFAVTLEDASIASDLSQAGVYESTPFANAELGGDEGMVTLLGSPGAYRSGL